MQTLHKYAYPAFGDFDIFMTVNKYIADDPKPICEPYKPKSNSNKLFCETIEDIKQDSIVSLLGWNDNNDTIVHTDNKNKILNITKIKNHFAPYGRFHHFVMQIYDYSKCDDMIKNYEMKKHKLENRKAILDDVMESLLEIIEEF